LVLPFLEEGEHDAVVAGNAEHFDSSYWLEQGLRLLKLMV
jgi:hypothetical protein